MTDPYVYEATDDDLRAAVANALNDLGLTFAELKAKHDSRDMNVKESIAWVAIGDLEAYS
jgi:hypothetical protein